MAPIRTRVRTAIDDLKDRVRTDGFIGLLSGLGGRRDATTSAYIAPPRYLTNLEILWLYHGSDLARKIVDLIPEEAMRLGWNTGEERLDRALKSKGVWRKFLDAWIWGRAYGRGALVLLYSDRLGTYDRPVRDCDVGMGDLIDVEPVEGYDLTVARRDARTGQVTHYYVTDTGGRAGGREIHASRFVLFRGIRTAERVKAERDGSDLGVLQLVNEMLRDQDQSWRGIMNLLTDLSQAVFKVKNLNAQIANGQKDQLLARMEIVDITRSIARAVIVDADTEDFTHVGAANVTGIEPILMVVFQRLAGAAGVPMTKLFGMSPAGMNATGESDRRNFQDAADVGRAEVTDQAGRLSRLYARSLGLDAREIEVAWPPLWAPTGQERAALETAQAQAAGARITAGLTDADEERRMFVTGKTPAEVIDLSPLPEGVAGEPPAEGSDVVPGSIWIDTDDGHRLEVTRVGTDAQGRVNVYYLDRDSTTPERQYSWRMRSFLERCRAAPASAPEAPAKAPAPGGAAA